MPIPALILVACLLAAVPAAQALRVTYGFTGTVTQVLADDPGGGIEFGTSFNGQYTFDDAVSDGIAHGSQGSYSALGPGFGLNLDVGANRYALTDLLNIGIGNDLPAAQYALLARVADVPRLMLQPTSISMETRPHDRAFPSHDECACADGQRPGAGGGRYRADQPGARVGRRRHDRRYGRLPGHFKRHRQLSPVQQPVAAGRHQRHRDRCR